MRKVFMKNYRHPILVIGIGNILLRDEGIGVRTIQRMQEIDVPARVLWRHSATIRIDRFANEMDRTIGEAEYGALRMLAAEQMHVGRVVHLVVDRRTDGTGDAPGGGKSARPAPRRPFLRVRGVDRQNGSLAQSNGVAQPVGNGGKPRTTFSIENPIVFDEQMRFSAIAEESAATRVVSRRDHDARATQIFTQRFERGGGAL